MDASDTSDRSGTARDDRGVTLEAADRAQREALGALQAEFYAHENLTLDGRVRAAVETLLETPELGAVYFIRRAGATVGYCVVTNMFSLEYGGRCGLVDELYVVPHARGQGVGTAVLAALGQLARQAGLRALHLEVDHANAAAQRVYARAGFVAKARAFMTRRL